MYDCDHCSNCDRNFKPVVCLQWPRGSFNAPVDWAPAATRIPGPVNKEDE